MKIINDVFRARIAAAGLSTSISTSRSSKVEISSTGLSDVIYKPTQYDPPKTSSTGSWWGLAGVIAGVCAGLGWCLFQTRQVDPDEGFTDELDGGNMVEMIPVNNNHVININDAIDINEIQGDNAINVNLNPINDNIQIIIQIEAQIALLQNLIAQQAQPKHGHERASIQ